VVVADPAMEVNVCLDSRTPQIAIEDRPGGLQSYAFVGAVEQLGKTLDRLGRQLGKPGAQPIRRFGPPARVARRAG